MPFDASQLGEADTLEGYMVDWLQKKASGKASKVYWCYCRNII